MLRVTLPGTGGTMPRKDRWLSCCMLSLNGKSVLVDCGEGTQLALKFAGCKANTIDTICITHFHADHIAGLPGLLLTMSGESRTAPVTMIGPPGLNRCVRSLCVVAPNLPFEVRCVEFHNGDILPEKGKLTIKPFPVRHSIPTLGYSFSLRRSGVFEPQRAKQNEVPLHLWKVLQREESAEWNGRLFTPDMVLGPERRGLKVTYTTDTRPVPRISEEAADADLLICEGMYGSDDKLPRAKESGHMLFSEAALLAAKANVRRLWLTHYSPSLDDPTEYLAAATDIFPDTECGFDGKTIDLSYDE